MSATLIGQLEESAEKLAEVASDFQKLVKKKKNKHKYHQPHVNKACKMHARVCLKQLSQSCMMLLTQAETLNKEAKERIELGKALVRATERAANPRPKAKAKASAKAEASKGSKGTASET